MATPRICAHPGCSKIAKYPNKYGFCGMHKSRLDRGQAMDGPPRRVPNGLMNKYLDELLATKADECIIWPFWRRGDGYAAASLEGYYPNYVGHSVCRNICTWVNGPPPSPEFQAAHDCGKGRSGCVNPRHLLWKTPKDNTGDKVRHGTAQRGSKANGSVLKEEDIPVIRGLLASGMTGYRIAGLYGVDHSTISMIKRGRTWWYVP